jgi:hypothetical protein
MRRFWTSSRVVLFVVLASSSASAQAPTAGAVRVPAGVGAPIPPAARAIADAIPDENTPEPESRHYFRSNEWRHDLYRPHVEGLGGAYVGVGSDQNYTLAAMAGSEMLFLVDFDPRIPWIHEIYRVLVSASETPDALIARFAAESVSATEQLLREGLASHPRPERIVRHFRLYREQWHTYLRRIQHAERDGRLWSWLGRPELYDHVRALHRGGRIVARNGDVTGEETMRAVGDAARRFGLTVRIVYFSNAEQFFRYTPGFRENIRSLPGDERSIVLRTFRHRDLPDAADDEWHYVVHDFADFSERLESGAYGRSYAFVPDIVAGGVGQAGISHITRETPRVMLEHLRRRRAERGVRSQAPRTLPPEERGTMTADRRSGV